MVVIYVNVRRSGSAPWLVSTSLSPSCDSTPPPELLEKVKLLVQSLPAVVSLPPVWNPSFIPRYYMIVLDGGCGRIVDIVGVRRDGTPTKWSFRAGYWHPVVQRAIVKAIDAHLKQGKRQ